MRILIIDNDTGFLSSWGDLLEACDHEVVRYSSISKAKRARVIKSTFDLAMVDLRMVDDRESRDESGLELAEQLQVAGTPTVLLTGHPPDSARLFQMVRMSSLAGIMTKDASVMSGMERAACVDQFRRTGRFPNGFARLRSSSPTLDVGQVLRDEIRPYADGCDIKVEELTVLLRSIISPCASQVYLKVQPPGRSGTAVLKATVSYDDGPPEHLAIKYGPRKITTSESVRYDRFVGPLPDGAAAQLRWRAETANLGAIAYSWVTDSVNDAHPFGPRSGKTWGHVTWPRRREALQRLMEIALDRWHEPFRHGENKLTPGASLLTHYTDLGGIWYRPVDHDADLILPVDKALTRCGVRQHEGRWDFGEGLDLADPVEWCLRGRGSTLTYDRQCPCHGDLHVANVFVLPDNSPRLIDFGRTGMGHVFRDFAAIEASIRLTCTDASDRSALMAAEDRISSGHSLGDFINYREVTGGCDLKEAVRATMQIRRAALDAHGEPDGGRALLEYLFAVTIHMLRYATGVADEIDSDNGDRNDLMTFHALYAAAKSADAAEARAKSLGVP